MAVKVVGEGALIAEIEKALELEHKKARAKIINAFSDIVIDSAVDTGRYRSNWQFGRSAGELEIGVTSASEVINRLSSAVPKEFESGKYYFYNNLKYAQKIEYEYDAHRGRVRARMMKLQQELEK